jgi:hypothetical protein
MKAGIHGFWRTLGQHPVFVGITLVGSLCSIVLPATGAVPRAFALVGGLAIVVLAIARYSILPRRPVSVSSDPAARTHAKIRLLAAVAHDDTLIAGEYVGVLGDFESKDIPLYREATLQLQAGELQGKVAPVIAQAIGDAITEWVGRGVRLLANGYPGCVHTPEKKEKTMNSLFRAAYHHMDSGRVVKFGNDHQLRNACAEVVRLVQRWVDLELVNRP